MSSGPDVVTLDKKKIFINELGQLVIADGELAREIKPYIDNLEHMTSLITVLKKDGCGGGFDPPIANLCHCGNMEDILRLETI